VTRKFTGLMVIAVASTLAGCASTVPATPAPVASATPVAAAPAASAAPTDAVPFVTPRGYRVETRNGEKYYCQRVTQTGSRAKAHETCYTLVQITEMRETGQDFVNRMQTSPTEMPGIARDATPAAYAPQ